MNKVFPALLLVGLFFCIAAATDNQPDPTATALTLSELTISNAEGKRYASLTADDNGVAFKMFDRHGQLALSLEVVHDSPRDRPLITLYDAQGAPRAAVGYPSFSLDPNTPDVAWNNDVPMIVFLGDDGEVTWHAPSDLVGPWERARFK